MISPFAALHLLASLIGRLIPTHVRAFGQAREQKPLVTGAAGEGEIVLLREIDGPANLDGQIQAGEGLVKFLPAQHAGAPPGALVQYPFG